MPKCAHAARKICALQWFRKILSGKTLASFLQRNNCDGTFCGNLAAV